MALFGSRLAFRFIQDRLFSIPAIEAAVGERIWPLASIPPETTFPALLHYAEMGAYVGAIGENPGAERLRYVVRLICEGWDDTPIVAAAEAMQAALDGMSGMVDGALVSVYLPQAPEQGEWPRTHFIDEDNNSYRELGNIFFVDVTTGG